MLITEVTTLAEAKKILRDNWESGVDCPCCGQRVKKYRRNLTTSMMLGLIDLYKKADGTVTKGVHIKDIHHVNGGEFAQMKRWGLIDDEFYDGSEKRTSGMWHLTYQGKLFAEGKDVAPAYVYTYNGKTIEVAPRQVSIRQAIGKKFNYQEMMEAR